MKKTYRQGQILKLIRDQTIRTQEELAEGLKKIGINVTQVTLSRDIHELGLAKGPQGYSQPQEPGSPGHAEEDTLRWVLAEFVRDVRTAGNLVIIQTAPGHAQPVALALDREGWPEVVGTVAGDDTIFAATPDSKLALKTKEKLLDLMR